MQVRTQKIPTSSLRLLSCCLPSIDGEWVPLEGDEVTYKQVHIPPKNEKLQAVHVVITHLKPGVHHERWDSPVAVDPEKPHD